MLITIIATSIACSVSATLNPYNNLVREILSPFSRWATEGQRILISCWRLWAFFFLLNIFTFNDSIMLLAQLSHFTTWTFKESSEQVHWVHSPKWTRCGTGQVLHRRGQRNLFSLVSFLKLHLWYYRHHLQRTD